MRVVAAILAAGRGDRFGGDKTQALLGRKPLWRWSYEAYAAHPEVDGVVLIGSEANLSALHEVPAYSVGAGGETRQESSRRALELAPPEAQILLVHDAARPFITARLITEVIAAVERTGAAAAGTRVTDTVKEVTADGVRTLDRRRLVAMQTPQGARTDLLRRAHESTPVEHTDEMALLEAMGVQPEIVDGDPENFKVTTPADLARARAVVGSPEIRTGLGYDIHPFSSDPARPLVLGGVEFSGHRGLEGHSDADVLLHAAADALLGAAALGDIGQHFPNTDPRWRGAPSLTFLRHAATLLAGEGWRIVNLDLALIAEIPKVMPHAERIRATIAEALAIEPSRVSLKATTNERLGAIGRSEGIAAFATATITERL